MGRNSLYFPQLFPGSKMPVSVSVAYQGKQLQLGSTCTILLIAMSCMNAGTAFASYATLSRATCRVDNSGETEVVSDLALASYNIRGPKTS